MAKVLIIRLSALGDVAMTVPVIYSAARSNPQDSFTVVTQAFLIPIFMNRPSNLEVIGINTKGAEKGLQGLLRFISALVRYDFDIVLDLQYVLRTVIIDSAFRLKGKKVYTIDKMRKERARLMAKNHKLFKPLRPVLDRYIDVFRAAGLNYTESFVSLFEEQTPLLTALQEATGVKRGRWIGIAPFARYREKIYPIDEMEKVVVALSKEEDVTIFLFGGRGYEEAVLEEWAYQYPRVHNVIGRYTLDVELALISRLDVFLSMDSANMHFASMVGTRVVSIWGGTHLYTGYYGFHQDLTDALQIDLPCRPCSIVGDKPCYRGDWACMQIPVQRIVDKVLERCSSAK